MTKNRKRYVITFFVYILFTVFFLANLWYNRYFGNYLSMTDMTMGQGVRPFTVLIRQLFLFKDILFLFEFPFLIYIIFFNKDKNYKRKDSFVNNNKSYNKVKLFAIFFIVIAFLGQVIYSNYYFGQKNIFELYKKSTPAYVSVYGILPLYLTETKLLYEDNNKDNNTENTAKNEEAEENKKLSGKYKLDSPKNIIVIQLESFDEKIIDYEYNGREITPFLNDLKEESLYFNNIYAQHVNGSFDAEFSFLTSLYPVNKNYAFKENDMSEFDSIIKILKDENYQTLAFHGNDEEFFYRDKGYLEIGFDKFYSREYFSADKGEVKNDYYLGINDYDFFSQSLDYLEEAKEPFFAQFITVSSHTPFNFYPEDEEIDDYNDISSKIVKDYFNSMAFVDKSLEMFFSELEKMGLKNDTLFVIYSDHTADINKEEYSSGNNFDIDKNIKEPENVPLMITHSDINKDSIDKTGTHVDISPTIIDILGYDQNPSQFLGNSLLEEGENPVLFLHEIPQILYKEQLFLHIPSKPENEKEFQKISYKNNKESDFKLTEKEKESIKDIIDYVQDALK
ncbi:MAG: LTA synthase family protein [Halanaerobium sp.]